MRLFHLGLENFRNFAAAQLPLGGRDVFLVGRNAQGKTNLLEAIGLLSALRSFRTTDLKALPRWETAQARLFYQITHEAEGETEVLVELNQGHKKVEVGGTQTTRLADFLGRFPAVVLSSADLSLVRGGPAERRRWLDLALASRDPAYYATLRRYTQALRGRNRLLKERGDPAAVAAFEAPLAQAAVRLIRHRHAELEALSRRVQHHYLQLSNHEDSPALTYRPSRQWSDDDEALAKLAAQRERDLALRSTSGGPHRDDLLFTLAQQPVREFGSEGQQRSFVLALKLAELDYLSTDGRPLPLLLADDVLGELDAQRDAAFWAGLDPNVQVIATGTRRPATPARDWQHFTVESGTVKAT